MKKIIITGALLATRLAFAGLDAAPSALPAARVQAIAATTTAGAAYKDIARTLSTGTVVHQYVDSSGAVFAVSWSGPFKPDLKELLGRHFDTLKDRGARKGNRARTEVDTGELVVEESGHMGAFEGHAWLPSRLPAGFDTKEMK